MYLFVSLFVPSVWPRSPCPSLDKTVGIPIGVLVACGLALLLLVALASWKLCFVPWRNKADASSSSAALTPDSYLSLQPLSQVPSPQQPLVGISMEKVKESLAPMGFLEAAVKISHTSPDIPAEVQRSMREHFLRRTRIQRQTTEPASSTR